MICSENSRTSNCKITSNNHSAIGKCFCHKLCKLRIYCIINRRHMPCSAICEGVWVMAREGLLRAKKRTLQTTLLLVAISTLLHLNVTVWYSLTSSLQEEQCHTWLINTYMSSISINLYSVTSLWRKIKRDTFDSDFHRVCSRTDGGDQLLALFSWYHF